MAIYTRQVAVLGQHRIREEERLDRLERKRRNEERQAWLESVKGPPGLSFDSLMAHLAENDPIWDEDEWDEDEDGDMETVRARLRAGQAGQEDAEAAAPLENNPAENGMADASGGGTGDGVNGDGVNGDGANGHGMNGQGATWTGRYPEQEDL